MKKTVFFLLLLFTLILIVSCGSASIGTTSSEVSTTETPTTTTTPITSTTLVTTQTADSTQSVPALQNEIEMLAENAHWLKIHRMGNVQYIKDKNGDQYTLTLTLNFLVNPGLQIPEEVQSPVKPIAAETMRVFLKNLTKDKDYTEYKVTELRQSDRWCDVWITLDGFVPEKDSEYDIAIFFSVPEGAETPGELVYAYLPEPWTVRYVPGPERPDPIATAWWQQVKTVHGIDCIKNADGSERYTFGLTIDSDSGFFPYLPDDDDPTHPGTPTLELTSAEGARVFIKDMNKDDGYTEYKVTNWNVLRWCDIYFEAEGFVAEEGAEYDMYLFFIMPEGTPHPGEYCFVWALDETWTLNQN